jgi:hypothetical protein
MPSLATKAVPAVLGTVAGLRDLVSQITLHFPERKNALSGAMVSALAACISQIRQDVQGGRCRGVLLRSSVPGALAPLSPGRLHACSEDSARHSDCRPWVVKPSVCMHA